LPVQGRPHSFIFMGEHFGATSVNDVPDFTNATHIWLPISINESEHTLSVPWRDAWDMSVFQ
jgi:hypothetical protein